jgi:hypothetical protein
MTRTCAIEGLRASAFAPWRHADGEPDWPEKNCYADLWAAFLHLLRLEPLAMLGHTVAVDFEGDQWTFFKPVHAELRELYGVDVQELTVWRPLEAHAVEHLGAGRALSVEVDAHWLPDTSGTDYRRSHTKTTVLLLAIDTEERRLTYLHNAGCFELGGEDYERIFRIGEPADPAYLPLFAEFVRLDRVVRREPADLAMRAVRLLATHYEWRPAANPFARFGERLPSDLAQMRERGLAYYHQWAFASVRQAGSAFELAAAHMEWLARSGYLDFAQAAPHFRALSSGCKALILKGARAVHTGKLPDVSETLRVLTDHWREGMAKLGSALQHAR